MKTLFILFATVFMFGTTPLKAAGPTTQTTTSCATNARGVQHQLANLLTFSSDQITPMIGEVDFIVRLRENGRLEVLDINGESKYSVAKVKQVLESSRILIAPFMVGKAFRIGLQYGSQASDS